jgi:SprB repeat/HYR domain
MFQSNCLFLRLFVAVALFVNYATIAKATAPSGHFNVQPALLLVESGGTSASTTVTVESITPVTCFGQSNGGAEINVTGGVAPYVIQWSNGANSLMLNNVPAGTYTVTVTGAAGSGTASASVTVTSPPQLSADILAGGVLTCTNTSVTLNTNVTGGILPYTYVWNNGATSTSVNIQTPGTYTLGIADANGCFTSTTEMVIQNTAQPNVTTSNPVITCTTPSVIIQSQGTPAPVTYAWTGPDGFSSALQNPTVSAPGSYILTVTSQLNGCSRTATATVTANTAAPVAVVAPPMPINAGSPNVMLNAGGSSTGANITYAWTTTNGSIASGANTLNPIVTSAGTYCLLVTNAANGCTSSTCVNVVALSGPFVTLQTVLVGCFGGATGSVTAEATGAAPLAYSWSTGATTTSIQGLVAGIYTITVTDAFGTTATAVSLVTQPTSAVQSGTTSIGETGVGANNGSATASVSGGTAPYTFLWSNGANTATINDLAPGTYTVVVTDANGCTSSSSTTLTGYVCTLSGALNTTQISCFGANNGTIGINLTNALNPVVYQWSSGGFLPQIGNLTAGTYTVTASDARNCSVILTTIITEPTLLSALGTSTPQTMLGINDGTASVVATGGTPPYTYQWSNGATTPLLTNLAPGTYTVVVSDANGCTTQVMVGINAVTCAVTAVATGLNPSCFENNNGSASAQMSGTPPYSFLWSTGSTSSNITGLTAGTYTVVTTDANGCMATVTLTLMQPTQLQVEVTSITNNICREGSAGSVEFVATGGVGNYTSTISGPGNQPNGSLNFGIHELKVTDGNGCEAIAQFFVGANDTIPPTITCPPNIAECDYALPISFELPTVTDNCILLSGSVVQTGGPVSGTLLTTGTYTLTFKATDAQNNTATCSTLVTISPLPDIQFVSLQPDMDSMGVGAINIAPIGGTPPYLFTWTLNGLPFAETEDLTGLFAGAYAPSIIDANGCAVDAAPFNISNLVDTDEAMLEASISLSPNPVVSLLTLKCDPALRIQSLQIQTATGRIWRTIQPIADTQVMDTQALPAGSYILQITLADGQRVSRRFVKL